MIYMVITLKNGYQQLTLKGNEDLTRETLINVVWEKEKQQMDIYGDINNRKMKKVEIFFLF